MSVSEVAPEVENLRLIFPYGECKDESSVFALLDAGLIEEGEPRAAAIDEAARLCMGCVQYQHCSDQREQIGQSLWASGIGSLVVGAQEVPLTAPRRSAVKLEATALEFDLTRDLPPDPDDRLFILRQAVRAGQVDAVWRAPSVANTAASWFEERTAATNPDVYNEAQTRMGPEAVTFAFKMIAGATIQLRIAGAKGQHARDKRHRDIQNNRRFEDDELVAVQYLDDVSRTWQVLAELSESNRGDFAKLARFRLPALLLNHSLEYVDELVEQNRVRYPELSGVVIRRAICEHPLNSQPFIDARVAQIAGDRSAAYRGHGRGSSGKLIARYERERHQAGVGQSEPGSYNDLHREITAVISTNSDRHPYLDSYYNQAHAQGTEHAAEWLRKLVASVEKLQAELLIDKLIVPSEDLAYFLSQYSYRRARRAAERFEAIYPALSDRYKSNHNYTEQQVRLLSRYAASESVDIALYRAHLDALEHDPDFDNSVSMTVFHRYARSRTAYTYDQVKRLSLAELVYGKYDRSKSGAKHFITRWMVQNVAMNYPLEEVRATADKLYEAIWRGFLSGMIAEVTALQPAANQTLAERICSPNGGFVTFRPNLWSLESPDRLAFATVSGLSRVIYGEQLDKVTMSAVLGVRDIDEYFQIMLKDKLQHTAERGYAKRPESLSTLGGLRQDLDYLDGRLRELGIRGADDHVLGQMPQIAIDTVVGAEIVSNALQNWGPEDTGLSPGAHDWLMQTIPRLYAPQHQAEVLTNTRELLAKGIISIEPRGNGYEVAFAPALSKPVGGLPDIELAVIAAVEKVDLLTHGGEIAVLLRERLDKAAHDRAREAKGTSGRVFTVSADPPVEQPAGQEPNIPPKQSTGSPQIGSATEKSDDALAAAATGATAHAEEVLEQNEPESQPIIGPELVIETSIRRLLARAKYISEAEIAAVVDRCLPSTRSGQLRSTPVNPVRVNHLLGLIGTVYAGYIKSREAKQTAGTGRVSSYAMQQLFGNGPQGGAPTSFDQMYQMVATQADLLGMGTPEPQDVLRYISTELNRFVKAAGV